MADPPSPLQQEERRHLRRWRLVLAGAVLAGLGLHALDIADTHNCGGHVPISLALYALRLFLIGAGVTALFWLAVQINSSLDKRLPLAVVLVAAAAWLAPAAWLWTEVEWRSRLAGFDGALAAAGALRPDAQGIAALPAGDRNLSACGGEVLIDKQGNAARMLFFTARGDDHYAGYLYAPGGLPPAGEMLPASTTCRTLSAAGWSFCIWDAPSAAP